MKKNNVNEQRRDFLKKTSLGVAGSAFPVVWWALYQKVRSQKKLK